MLKMQNKIIDSLLVCVLALGLGGCATSSVATHKANHEPTSTKIAKQSSHKKLLQKLSKQILVVNCQLIKKLKLLLIIN